MQVYLPLVHCSAKMVNFQHFHIFHLMLSTCSTLCYVTTGLVTGKQKWYKNFVSPRVYLFPCVQASLDYTKTLTTDMLSGVIDKLFARGHFGN